MDRAAARAAMLQSRRDSVLFGDEREQMGAIIRQQGRKTGFILLRQAAALLCQMGLCTFGFGQRCKLCPERGTQGVRCSQPRTTGIGFGQVQLRRRMAFGSRAFQEFHASHRILRMSEPQRVDAPQQKFCLGISRLRSRRKLRDGLAKLPALERITRRLHVSKRRHGKQADGKGSFIHRGVLCIAFLLAGLAQAQVLPKPLMPQDYPQYSAAEVEFGRALFFDPLLSGNRNIACASCHNPALGGSDGLALGIGEGGTGHGPARQMGRAEQRQARNAPALWDLGARQVQRLFHDGRVERRGAVIRSPAGDQLPAGLNSLLAAQVLFPLIARTEMGGAPERNEIAAAAQNSAPEAWALIAQRVGMIAQYSEMAGQVEIDITMIANALAAYISTAFRSVGSDFDRYLAGEVSALDPDQRAGMALFYGAAQCSQCHSGPLLSDQAFHNLALPPLGPGRTRRFDPVARDTGRLAVSDDVRDSYRFRTPFLRNVARTAPYGHNGVFPTLQSVIRHHMDPLADRTGFTLPKGIMYWQDVTELLRVRAAFLAYPAKAQVPATLRQGQVDQLIRFLHSLSTPQANHPSVPETLPSGLEPLGD